jgi:hypothetical protein
MVSSSENLHIFFVQTLATHGLQPMHVGFGGKALEPLHMAIIGSGSAAFACAIKAA